jgi:crotonobetainyl-CoA:carnitine CoA-transferase CaiB-like acyl-CoA transferase
MPPAARDGRVAASVDTVPVSFYDSKIQNNIPINGILALTEEGFAGFRWFGFRPSSERKSPIAMLSTALRGLTVVEAGSRLAVAVCGQALRELGAEVLVVDAFAGAGVDDRAARQRETFSAGKRVVRGGSEALDSLNRRADVVLTSSDVDTGSTDTLAGYDRLIRCDITAFGHGAHPDGRLLGDLEIQALSGIAATTGMPDGPPTPIALPVVDIMTGLHAACAVILAVRERRRSGRGQVIDMALFDSAFAAMSTFLSSALTGGRALGRIGNMHTSAAPWNAFRARDGWVMICAGSDMQWERLCQVIGRPDLVTSPRYRTQSDRVARHAEIDSVIEAWTQERAVDDCVTKLLGAMVAASRIVPIDDYPREPNLDHRKSVRCITDPHNGTKRFAAAWPLRGSASSPPRTRSPDDRGAPIPRPETGDVPPLAGVRIVEIGHYTTAPLTARHCASMGALVVKIEPPGGESTRTWPPLQQGESIFFRSNNAEKLGICLDLKQAADVELLKTLLRDADVLVENLKPGALAKLGFSWDALQAINPRLIYCSITGFGADSIYANRPAFDTVIQAASGFMDAVGDGTVPVKSGISSSDLLGAQFALLGVLGALEAREASGAGVWIDLSMQDVTAWATQTAWNGSDIALEHDVVPCRDGHVLAARARSTPPAAVSALAANGGKSRDELVTALSALGVVATPILDVQEVTELAHCRERGLWTHRVENGVAWPLLASPLRLTRTPPRLDSLAPKLDQHRDTVVAAWQHRATTAGAPPDAMASATTSPSH